MNKILIAYRCRFLIRSRSNSLGDVTRRETLRKRLRMAGGGPPTPSSASAVLSKMLSSWERRRLRTVPASDDNLTDEAPA
uniref:Uncharacterized protein n=1 Tax=Romanomermis culicivorax TaxID=13658 RepID=A0A915JU99_ROMCU